MQVEELADAVVGLDLVLTAIETVALVGEQEVLDRDIVGTHRLDNLVGLHLQHTRIVGALE